MPRRRMQLATRFWASAARTAQRAPAGRGRQRIQLAPPSAGSEGWLRAPIPSLFSATSTSFRPPRFRPLYLYRGVDETLTGASRKIRIGCYAASAGSSAAERQTQPAETEDDLSSAGESFGDRPTTTAECQRV